MREWKLEILFAAPKEEVPVLVRIAQTETRIRMTLGVGAEEYLACQLQAEGHEYEVRCTLGHYHNAYHNAERVGGGLWRLSRKWEIEKPRKMGFWGLP